MGKPRWREVGGAFCCMFADENFFSTAIMGFFDFIRGKKSDKPNFGGLGLEANTETALYFQTGVDKYVSGNYKEAVVAFSAAIQKMPANANFYTFRGTAYEDSNDDISAQKDFEQACSLDPTSFLAAYRLGMVYARKKDFDNAITWFYKAYNSAPDVTEMHHVGFGTNSIFFVGKQIIAGNLGNMLFQGKSPNEALRILERAIELEPQYPNPYMTKGLVLARLGNNALAKTFLEKAYNMGMKQAKPAIDALAREEFIDKGNNELKAKFRPDIMKNVQAILAFKSEGRVGVEDLEQEAIYYACDIILHQKSQTGRFPSDEIMTDIIKCTTDVMRELFPGDYTEKHAAFAQEGVRINLTQAPDMQQYIDRYYAKIYQREQ